MGLKPFDDNSGHPCLCGEHFEDTPRCFPVAAHQQGQRGTRESKQILVFCRRSIPACTGNIRPFVCRFCWPAVHPPSTAGTPYGSKAVSKPPPPHAETLFLRGYFLISMRPHPKDLARPNPNDTFWINFSGSVIFKPPERSRIPNLGAFLARTENLCTVSAV